MTVPFPKHAALALLIHLLPVITVCAQNPSNPEQVPLLSTNLYGFEIPFSVNDPDNRFIEVQLYVSQDRGQNWSFQQSRPVGSGNFQFKCDGDGEYWFAMKTLDRDRKLIPGGNVVYPEMRIEVDSVRPKLAFNISADPSGRIIASWRVEDSNLDLSTIQISYRGAGDPGSDWHTLEFTPNQSVIRDSYIDQIAWWPKLDEQKVEIRFEIADRAGNRSMAIRTTQLMSASMSRQNISSTLWKKRQPNDFENCPGGVCQPRRVATNMANAKGADADPGSWIRNVVRQAVSQANTVPPSQPTSRLARQRLVASDDPPSISDSIPWESKTSQWVQREQSRTGSTMANNQFPFSDQDQFSLKRRFDDVPVVNRESVPPVVENRGDAGKEIEPGNFPAPADMFVTESSTMKAGNRQVAVTTNSNQLDQGQPAQRQQWMPAEDELAPKQPGSPTQYIDPPVPQQPAPLNSPASPIAGTSQPAAPDRSQINRGTMQRGKIPVLQSNHPRFNLSYDVRAIDPSGVGKVILWETHDGGQTWNSIAVDPDNKSPFPVHVQSEGTYGFKVVINSRDGLTGKPPVSGELPDVWVDVDWTRPTVRIDSVPYGSGKDIGKLIIQFTAADANLAIRPIRLYFSPNADGPWTTIEQGLRNSGSYAWKVPSHIPERVFLRIEARDTANNVGAYQLTSPIDLSGLVPRGHIYGVEPISQ